MGEPLFYKRRLLNKETARELYDKGYCDQQIADHCGVTYGCVREWRRKSGLEGHKAPYKMKKKKPNESLVETAAEAKAHGMTYGQYMAMKNGGMV